MVRPAASWIKAKRGDGKDFDPRNGIRDQVARASGSIEDGPGRRGSGPSFFTGSPRRCAAAGVAAAVDRARREP
jgi:hypothetical protein